MRILIGFTPRAAKAVKQAFTDNPLLKTKGTFLVGNRWVSNRSFNAFKPDDDFEALKLEISLTLSTTVPRDSWYLSFVDDSKLLKPKRK